MIARKTGFENMLDCFWFIGADVFFSNIKPPALVSGQEAAQYKLMKQNIPNEGTQ